MKGLFDNWIDAMIHGIVAMDQAQFIRMFGDELAQVKMHFFALKALIVGKFDYFKPW